LATGPARGCAGAASRRREQRPAAVGVPRAGASRRPEQRSKEKLVGDPVFTLVFRKQEYEEGLRSEIIKTTKPAESSHQRNQGKRWHSGKPSDGQKGR